MQISIEHLGLPSKDPAALKDWYARVLDAQVVFDNRPSPFPSPIGWERVVPRQVPPMYLLRLPGGGIMIEIYAGDFALDQTANNKLNGWRHVALRVDSIEQAREELERRGVRFTEDVKPAGGGGRVLFFQDPEGNLLHFVERPADSPLAAR